MATIKDVAREAGVTVTTVSFVLNNSGRVGEATRQRVLEAARRLNYRPSIIAQNLRAGESRIIGYAWHTERPGEWTAVMQQFLYNMSAAAETAGYHVLTFIADPADPVSSYLALADTARVDGFVLAYTTENDPRIHRLLSLGIPFVAFGRTNFDWDFPYVDVDGTDGMRQVVEHLLAQGHRRIGLINWPAGSLAGGHRAAGYVQALQAAGIRPASALQTVAQNSAPDGYAAVQTLMCLPPDERPTAIACVSDVIAIGAMQWLSEAGYTVGQDIAITGFDDVPTAAHLSPPLTSVAQPLDTVGKMVIDILLEVLQGRQEHPHQVLLKPRLMIRASSARVGASRPDEQPLPMP